MTRTILFLFLLFLLPVTVNAQSWMTLKSFSGSGAKNTEPFTVQHDEWRITFSSEANDVFGDGSGAGHILQLYLLEPGQELYEGEIIANGVNEKTIEGTTHMYRSGRFYIKSNSANGKWRVRVQVKVGRN